MPQIAYAGTAEVIDEEYYEYDIPPNLLVRLNIHGRIFRLELRGDAKTDSDKWYNNTYVTEITEGHV